MTITNVVTGVSVVLCFLIVAGCSGAADGDTYTLYRNSAVLENGRLHVASFDAADGDRYNSENCKQALELFQAQPGVKVKFWCEKGRFKK
jgi:hypothetical protein